MITEKRLSELNCSDLSDFNTLLLGKYALGERETASNLFMEANTRQQNNFLIDVKNNEDWQPSVQSAVYKFFDNLLS